MPAEPSTLYVQAFSLITCLEDDLKGILAADKSGMVLRDDLVHGRSLRFGTMRSSSLPKVPEGFPDVACNRISLYCLGKLEDEIAKLLERYGKDRVGVVIGSSNAGIHETQMAVDTFAASGGFPPWFGLSVLDIGLPSHFIAARTGITGPAFTISTACTSSAKAFSAADRLISVGACDAAIAGGVDPLCTFASNGFYALEALSEGYSNPFSKNRDGVTLGEAGALFIISREKAPLKIAGIGETSDAYHMTSPDPSGACAAASMRMALEGAGIGPSDIGYVKLHGTGTKHNDIAEGRAVFDVFGGGVPCGSLKPLIGHTLGACGAVELAHCCLLLDDSLNPEGNIPPHPWDCQLDPEIAPINLSKGGRNRDLKNIVLNTFAFGGSNVSMVLGRVE
jgi:3-oxoacyl-[acyl-carrier-protein] synthase-1